MSGKAKFRFLLLLVLAGVFGYVGFLVFKERDPMPPLRAAEKLVLQDGPELEKQGNHRAAAEKYDQANVLLDHTIKRLNGPHGMDIEELKLVSGKAYRLKAMAIRDKYYALGAAASKPLEMTRDSVTGEMFRNVVFIPDAKDREEAAANIRGAAVFFLPKDYQAQLDALRLELMAATPPWDSIEKLCKAILEVEPKDNRARYLLAKIEFEQPQLGTNLPTPASKRSESRVHAALVHIDEVREDPKFPRWRTEFLKAQIHRWYSLTEKKKKNVYFEQMEILDRLLLDEVTGATARINKGEKLDNLTKWDADGVMGLHGMAADVALEIIRVKKSPDHTNLARVFDHTLAFCEKKIEEKDQVFARSMALETMLNVMTKSQSILAMHDRERWQKAIDFLRPIIREDLKRQQFDPYLVAQLAELLMREAHLRRAETERAEELRTEARKWLDDGLEYGKKTNINNQQMLPFNLLAANVIYYTAGKRETIAPYLQALYETKYSPHAKATALLIDGAYDEFEGRLERARFKFEQAAKEPGGQEEIRSHAALASIYMAMGKPDAALVSLQYLQTLFDRMGDLTDHEKDWVFQFLRSPQDFYALTVVAHLEDARKKVVRYMREHPKAKTFPYEMVKDSEEKVRKLLSQELPKSTAAGLTAHAAFVSYLTATQRRIQAEKIWNDLATDYSDRFELLPLRVALKIAEFKETPGPFDRTPEIDKLIKEFKDKNPTNVTAKLYWATWLSQTKRTQESLAYLKEISDDGKMTPEMRRLAHTIILVHNTGANVSKVMQHLRFDLEEINDVIIRLGDSIEKQQSDIRAALTRHETLTLSRVMKAEEEFQKGHYDESAKIFSNLLDFTRTKSLAQHGVLRSMLALTNQDADKARDVNRDLLAEYPQESIFLLTSAFVFLAQEDVGDPTDNWQIQRTMGSALNIWEKYAKDYGVPNPVGIPLTRAEFWFHANRMDVAYAEMQRALNYDRQNPGVLTACAFMILADPAHEKDRIPELKAYVADLKRLAPKIANTWHLEARVEEYQHNWNKAIELYEALLSVEEFKIDHTSYMRLMDLLDQTKEYDRAIKWVAQWRKKLPTDLSAISAEIRFLARKGDLDAAKKAGDAFVAESVARATEIAQKIKEPKSKTDEVRAKFIDDARGRAELELARGFYLGGANDETERRLRQLPKGFLNGRLSQELLGEILIKQGEALVKTDKKGKIEIGPEALEKFTKAEEIFEKLFKADRRNLTAANNLAYLLSQKLDKAERAREVVRESLRGRRQSQAYQTPDRVNPDYLATIGAVYVKLANEAYAREMNEFFLRAVERYKSEPRVHLYLGYSRELIGDYNDAERMYRDAVEKNAHLGLTEIQRNQFILDAEAFQKRLRDKRQNVQR